MIQTFDPMRLLNLFAWLVWLVCLPGYLIATVAWRTQFDLLQRLGMSFAIGMTLFAVQCIVAYLVSCSLEALFWSSSALSLGLVVVFITRAWHARRAEVLNRRADNAMQCDRGLAAVVVGAAVLGSFISLASGWYPRGDAAIHLQAIRKMVHQAALTQPIYSLISQPVLWDHAFDAYYPLIALLVRRSGLELTIVWHYLSGLLALLLPFSVYAMVRELTSNRAVLNSSILFLFLVGLFSPSIMFGTVFDALVYPNRVYLWLLFPPSLALAFRFLRNGDLKYGVVSASIAVGQLAVHANGFLFYFWVLGGMGLLALFRSMWRRIVTRRAVAQLVLTTLLAAPLLWLKWPYSREFVRLASLPLVWHQYYKFYYLGGGFYAFDPRSLLDAGRLVGLGIALFALFRGIRRRCDVPLLEWFLAAGFLVPLLVVYNPIVMPIAASLFSYPSVGRMQRIPPYFLAYAYGVSSLFPLLTRAIGSTRSRRLAMGFLYCAIVGVFLSLASPGIHAFSNLDFRHHVPRVAMMAPLLKPGSLVLSDLVTSTDLITFADVYTLVIQFNGPVDLIDITDGRRVVDQVLGQKIPFEEARRILIDQGVDYVVVDRTAVSTDELFRSHPEVFRFLYSDDRYTLYEVTSHADDQ